MRTTIPQMKLQLLPAKCIEPGTVIHWINSTSRVLKLVVDGPNMTGRFEEINFRNGNNFFLEFKKQVKIFRMINSQQ